MKRLGLKGSLFILPTIVIIAVFSLWPIIRAFTYTFFDYRLNDQQNSNLYLSERYNAALFNENADYIIMFLNQDMGSLPAEAQDKARAIIDETNAFKELLKGKTGFISLSGDFKTQVENHTKSIISSTGSLADSYDFKNGKNLRLVASDLEKCIVRPNYIGLEGYGNALKDKRIGTAVVNTVVFTIFSVFLEFILGLGLAIIMNRAVRGRGPIRAVSLIPWAIPTAVAALVWNYLYDGSSGIVSHLFQVFHIVGDSKELLLTGTGAMISTILADVWKTTPYMALLILAGFQTIPSVLYESSQIDGAGTIKTFFKITLPLLKPTILVALLFRTLDAFRVFDLVYVLTGGGPGGSTETLSIYAYKLMFEQTNFGYGSIVVFLMFICVAVIATFFVKFLGTNLMDVN
jgi:multiple sugar transport system permease protein